ncbi:dihydrolipoamide acetyltransferase family protein [Ensifer soli]|uniref:dihydrolipoamide acetyltransferase family protein n=1 Tax=Ciceribacter sp. sgz301302 TaxID=3342379 RepID=UPI0035BB92A1
MPVEVILPKVDMDMATGRISKWFFEANAPVKKGEVLFEIETDKAAMEVDAPASGVLRDVVGAEGVDIAVGSAVAWIYEEGEAYAKRPAATGTATVFPKAAEGGGASAGPILVPAAAKGETVRATPLARRLARQAGLDLASVAGSGPHGRVTRADVEARTAADAAQVVVPAPAVAAEIARPADVPRPAETVRRLFAEGSYEVVPHTSMRRTIARRLVEAKSTVPHFYLSADCSIDALLTLRTELNASAPQVDGKPDYKISVNDMVIKAYAMALRAVPGANVSWEEDHLLKHRHADIGVAVSVPGGLITPIVRRAEIKTLSSISNEMKDLAARAREGKLKGEEYQGGTGAISNLGMFGVRDFAAIVNPPHATILAVGAGERRPVIVGDAVKAATLMTVTLSTDHRAVDGALGAELLAAFRSYIERPMAMIV